MTTYEILLFVPAALLLLAVGLVVLAFFQYTPEELALHVGNWLKANIASLALYAALLTVLLIFLY